MRSTLNKTIRIVSRNIVLHDAVSNFAIDLYKILKNKIGNVCLYAQGIASEYAGCIKDVSCLKKEIHTTDTLICSYSIFDAFFVLYSQYRCSKKILYFHNVTPEIFFRPYSKEYSSILESSHRQYNAAINYDAVIANSRFSLEQILPYVKSDIPSLVHPPFFSLNKLDKVTVDPLQIINTEYSIIWVGRLTPHKRPHIAMAIFGELYKLAIDVCLIFIGSGRNDFPNFATYLESKLAILPEKTRAGIYFIEGISDEQLAYLYHKASLLLCTSAHEGYCMPLVEAAACNLPVAAMPQPAVLETLGGRGLILDEDPQKAARQIRDFLVNNNEEERRRATPVVPDLPTDALLRLILGEE